MVFEERSQQAPDSSQLLLPGFGVNVLRPGINPAKALAAKGDAGGTKGQPASAAANSSPCCRSLGLLRTESALSFLLPLGA